ncbi:uncharacterized protein DAT39_021512 [Clarias magur]|uniref:Uncharacterized protein n=1 Tax=Clarias magur TaxID=1594786 RepID=A0A8J4U2Y1_CLAMG|nr:uncharacterized protein DAT39_021512 [Clarias magur]
MEEQKKVNPGHAACVFLPRQTRGSSTCPGVSHLLYVRTQDTHMSAVMSSLFIDLPSLTAQDRTLTAEM